MQTELIILISFIRPAPLARAFHFSTVSEKAGLPLSCPRSRRSNACRSPRVFRIGSRREISIANEFCEIDHSASTAESVAGFGLRRKQRCICIRLEILVNAQEVLGRINVVLREVRMVTRKITMMLLHNRGGMSFRGRRFVNFRNSRMRSSARCVGVGQLYKNLVCFHTSFPS
jgi:hypothetical protein